MAFHDANSVQALVNWLEAKDPATGYEWLSGQCLYGAYFEEVGAEFRDPPHYGAISLPAPHTYGAALERARAFL
jgi:hypothetical protein